MHPQGSMNSGDEVLFEMLAFTGRVVQAVTSSKKLEIHQAEHLHKSTVSDFGVPAPWHL